MNRFLIRQDEKIINIRYSDPKKKEILLFIEGMLPYPISHEASNKKQGYPDKIYKRFDKKTKFNIVSFDWFASSNLNKSAYNIKPFEYVNELSIIFEFINKNFNFEKIHFISNSFGSFPLVQTLNRNIISNDKIGSIIFRSPVFNDSVNSLKYRIRDKNIFFGLLLKNDVDDKLKLEIISSYKDINDDSLLTINAVNSTNSLILIGENESYLRKDISYRFANTNGIQIREIKNAGHLIYEDKKNTRNFFKNSERIMLNFLESHQ